MHPIFKSNKTCSDVCKEITALNVAYQKFDPPSQGGQKGQSTLHCLVHRKIIRLRLTACLSVSTLQSQRITVTQREDRNLLFSSTAVFALSRGKQLSYFLKIGNSPLFEGQSVFFFRLSFSCSSSCSRVLTGAVCGLS